MEGGRFDFSDGGSYVGEWSEGRAHGLGLATGPENHGEYSGEWTMGFESRGVYVWPSGNIYSGTWLKGKRHGEGVQIKGRWIYRGAFTTGFCGRYGVKESLTSCSKYEGNWHLNQFDGYGVETNTDGSVYSGMWSKGMRQGLGIRRSAPYNLASEFSRSVRAAQSQNSLRSGTDSERGWRGTGSIGGGSGGDVTMGGDRTRLDERRSGFVLRSISSPSIPSTQSKSATTGHRSATPSLERKSLFNRGLFKKLRKQKSTGDLSIVGTAPIGNFSSSSGCGGGGIFQSRGRRSGGSLRSTLSGTSQITTNSFGRTEMADGRQIIREMIEEQPGPNVTETYSGQWNEDRRSGYGIAERSDGLKYAGEWFNNKKDGYGVTYLLDGTREEGKYKENILIQALNRRSKLFLIRHTKLRDATDDAVKNAQEAAKEAQEKSEKAYEKAQTARMIASTADARARDARKLSDEARLVAAEFAPDFAQLGIQWEKQNPLVKKELFGVGRDNPDGVDILDQQAQRTIRMDDNAMNMEGLEPDRLEVSGGSRHGSFRSSFRRYARNKDSNMVNGSNQESENQSQITTQRGWQVDSEIPGPAYGSIGQMNKISNDPQRNIEDRLSSSQRSPAGRPIARAATSGVAGIGYAQYDHKEMAQHMAQHPHSPYLMASPSQQIDQMGDSQYATMPRQRQIPTSTGMNTPHGSETMAMQGGKVVSANVNRPHHQAPEVRMGQAQLIQPSQVQHAVLQIEEKVDTSSIQTEEINPQSTLEQIHQVRRRTLPSIITDPHASRPGWNDSQSAGGGRSAAIRKIRPHMRTAPIDEDAIHSEENLPLEAAETYIIENGIRKRVHAVTRQQQQRAKMAVAHKLPEDEELDGRRPEWTTAYDSYRPAMESTFDIPRGSHNQHSSPSQQGSQHQPNQSGDPFEPLPRTYQIESDVNLVGSKKESSLPDLPSACQSLLHGTRRQAGLTREELSKLTQERRVELMHEMERRKRGEIVIRLADIKDWVRNNFVIVFVILVNASLAFMFFNLLNGQPRRENESHTQPSTSQPQNTGLSGQATLQMAKKVMGKVMKKTKFTGRGGAGSGTT